MIRTIGTGENPKKYNLSDVIETLVLSPTDVEKAIGVYVTKTNNNDVYINEDMFRRLLLNSHGIGDYIKSLIELESYGKEMENAEKYNADAANADAANAVEEHNYLKVSLFAVFMTLVSFVLGVLLFVSYVG